MTLPFFYQSQFNPTDEFNMLDEDTSKHVVNVLRMKNGDLLHLTDGKGNLVTAEITDNHKKKCLVKVMGNVFRPRSSRKVTIAISLLKNAFRFEWFLEKATEIGISEIIPMLCERTDKQKFRIDRMQQILISAMLQSQQCWLPTLHEPIPFQDVIAQSTHQQKFIAHCIEEEKRNLVDLVNESLSSQIILIGPAGDFTIAEVRYAIQHHFDAVSLGNTRLRTETAGVAAAVLLTNPS
jgi:16S rRNA (uracil1498-N3)-methyltransferase